MSSGWQSRGGAGSSISSINNNNKTSRSGANENLNELENENNNQSLARCTFGARLWSASDHSSPPLGRPIVFLRSVRRRNRRTQIDQWKGATRPRVNTRTRTGRVPSVSRLHNRSARAPLKWTLCFCSALSSPLAIRKLSRRHCFRRLADEPTISTFGDSSRDEINWPVERIFCSILCRINCASCRLICSSSFVCHTN